MIDARMIHFAASSTEFFNLFNTPQYTTPNTDFSNINDFGRLQSTQLFTNRQISSDCA
ncbi:MAG: hypothetical protein H0V27_10540 [Pyrinomonadaceae bacterium]|nr:hypothetical protein [Pyrinomonadaceae bacterium]